MIFYFRVENRMIEQIKKKSYSIFGINIFSYGPIKTFEISRNGTFVVFFFIISMTSVPKSIIHNGGALTIVLKMKNMKKLKKQEREREHALV